MVAVRRDRFKFMRYLTDTKRHGVDVWEQTGVKKVLPAKTLFIALRKGFKVHNLKKAAITFQGQQHGPGKRFTVYRAGTRKHVPLEEEALKHPAFPALAFEQEVIHTFLPQWQTRVFQRRGLPPPNMARAGAAPSWEVDIDTARDRQLHNDSAARLDVTLFDAVKVLGSRKSRVEDQVLYACHRLGRLNYSYVQVVSGERADRDDLPALPADPLGQLVCIFSFKRIEAEGINRPPVEEELFAVVLRLQEVSAEDQERLFSLRHATHGHRSLFKVFQWRETDVPREGLPMWARLQRDIVPMSRIRPAAIVPVCSGDNALTLPVLGDPKPLSDRFFHLPHDFTDRYRRRRWEGPQTYESITERRRNQVRNDVSTSSIYFSYPVFSFNSILTKRKRSLSSMVTEDGFSSSRPTGLRIRASPVLSPI